MPRTSSLRVDRVLIDPPVSTPHAIFDLVAHDLKYAHLVRDPGVILKALDERERAHSTALAGGIAMPHARVAGLGRGLLTIVKLAVPVTFTGATPTAVDLVIVIVSPAEDPAEHLKQLARISRKLHDPGCVAKLRAASDEQTLRAALEDD
ncbi:MAG TPA: PTS sugar transporter subunit IIA [Candidatus Sulfotelmatobacter sp.]|nr:PTS sugar transporter subunit IIA [Candidatus Sulfotelmatobacter sp.]